MTILIGVGEKVNYYRSVYEKIEGLRIRGIEET